MNEATRFEPWPGTDWPPRPALVPVWAWQLVVAAALAGALVVAFLQVVQGAVADGERRRQKDALAAMELSQCNTLGDVRSATDCLREIGRRLHEGAPGMLLPEPVARDR